MVLPPLNLCLLDVVVSSDEKDRQRFIKGKLYFSIGYNVML